MACRRDIQVRNYLGTNWSQRHNWKLRTVIDMLLNHDKVKQVSTRPLILQWIQDVRCDVRCDVRLDENIASDKMKDEVHHSHHKLQS
jgi:hypothetical protein